MDKIKYIKNTDFDALSTFLAAQITTKLTTGKVLWMLSGGSAIQLAVATRPRLPADLNNLAVTLIDERYGPPGHPGSNWTQLGKAGFDFSGLNAHPILEGLEVSKTTENFNDYLNNSLNDGLHIIGLFGMGADGHTAGILPHSPAFKASNFAASYSAADYIRITIAPKFISKLDEAYLYAVDPAKHEQLKKLRLELPAEDQPAQLLKKVGSLTIINDIEGENI